MLLVVAVSVGVLAGCEDKKSDNSDLSLLLAAAASRPWVVVSPANWSPSVPYDDDIVLKYNRGTLNSVVDVESVQITEEGDGPITYTGDAITISGDTVTINPPLSNTFPASGTIYFNLVISGFTDSNGDPIPEYSFPNYRITSEPK
ncbi:MAG TPA: hypothetical protein PLD91_09795 [Spirochaetota bacterium]|nr:hypothetical protein [Spirochaetota bacterium]